MSVDKIIVLLHPDGEGKSQEYKMTVAKAEKMLNSRTTSKKWDFKDEKTKFVPGKDGKKGTIQIG